MSVIVLQEIPGEYVRPGVVYDVEIGKKFAHFTDSLRGSGTFMPLYTFRRACQLGMIRPNE